MNKILPTTRLLKANSAVFFLWCFAMLASVQVWGQAGTYTRINSAAALTDGYYVITYNGTKAMGSAHTGTLFPSVDITSTETSW